MLQALSVDPGGIIGWCIADLLPEPDLLTITEWGEDKHHQAFLDVTWDRLIKHKIGWIICENYVPRPGIRTWQPEALHQIGVLKWMAGHVDVPFILQSVGDASAFATPDKLAVHRQAGVGRGGGGHALMSLKHMIRWRYIGYYG